MPDILSALDKIAHESEQIKRLAHVNDRPPGPFTSAYLYLPVAGGSPPNLFSLVRDATEAEKRPFGSLLSANPHARNARVANANAKAQGSTPLRKVQRARGTPRELEATLTAAAEVIDAMADSAQSMSRARKEVGLLLTRHKSNAERLVELQRLLDEAMRAPPKSAPAQEPEPAPSPAKEKKMTPDEAIAAEEEALRALEASLAPLRREVGEKKAALRSPARKSAPSSPISSRSPRSPRVEKTPLAKSQTMLRSSASSQTPSRAPPASTFASRLLETPRAEPLSRFDPLHLVATPRTRLGSSTLGPGSTIVSRMRASITPAAPRSAYRSSFLASSSKRVLAPRAPSPDPAPLLVPDISTTPKSKPPAVASRKSPTPSKPKPPPEPASEPGIDPDLPAVVAATVSLSSPPR